MSKNLLIWLSISFILVLTLQNSLKEQEEFSNVSYNQLIEQVENGKIASVKLQGQDIIATRKSGQEIRSILPAIKKLLKPTQVCFQSSRLLIRTRSLSQTQQAGLLSDFKVG